MGLLDIFKKSAGGYALFNSVGRNVNYRHDKLGYLSLNEKTLYVSKGIDKRGEKVAQTQWKLFKGEKEIETHPVLNLLDRPNPNMAGHKFWKLASMYRDVTGECWIRKTSNGAVFSKNQKVSRLDLLIPHNVTKVFNTKKDDIIGVQYTHLDGSVEDIPMEELIYWNHPSLINPLEGMSLLMAGLRSIMTENQLIELQNKIAHNGGKLDGVFRFKNDNLTKEQMVNLKASFKESVKDAKENTDNILFVGGGGEYQNIALNPNEIGYLDSRKLFADDMVVITGVPRAILGVTSGETFSNAEIAVKIFLRETVKPIVDELANLLDWHLVPDDLDISFVDPTPEDIENKLKVVDTAEKSNTLSINERREILGYEPVKGGDDIMVSFTKVPLGTDLTPSEQPEEKQVKKKISHPLANVDVRRAYNLGYQKSLASNRKRLFKVTQDYFADQERRLIQSLQGRKQIKTKSLFGDVWNTNLEVTLGKAVFLNVLRDIVISSGQETIRIFEGEQNFNLTSTLDGFVSKRTEFFANQINETVAQKLENTFTEWHSNDETLNDLVKRIQDDYGGIKDVNARRIANTETGIFMQQAKQEAYQQMNFAIKIWTWAPGLKGGVREDHVSMDGEEVPIHMPFSNGMMHPGDPSAGVENLANCECSI